MNRPDNKTIKELIKLYPKIKIPYFDEYEYYINICKTFIPNLSEILSDMNRCTLEHQISSYKMKKLDEIIQYFKEDKKSSYDNFNNIELPKVISNNLPKSFSNYEHNENYISIDMCSANWTILSKYILGIDIDWINFMMDVFDLDPFLAKSKSYRQLVCGNLNPGRQQAFQKYYMSELANKLSWLDIKCVSTDEIIIKDCPDTNYTAIQAAIDSMPISFKVKLFNIQIKKNYGDQIIIKNDKELFGVPGNRFYLHYKTLIMQEPLDEKDLYFEPEPHKLAKWII